MSILRIVEGEMKNTTTGAMDLKATDGNFEAFATNKNSWHGHENGIFEHHYEAPHPADTLNDTIDVTLNIFFDGTQNNKDNTVLGKDYKESNHRDDSYTNDFSNVARGYDAIDNNISYQEKIYIEGIATQKEESDDVFPDVAMGMGNRGVVAKVTKACVEAGKKASIYSEKKIDELIVNVFGFSRGAAAARHFLHIANSAAVVSFKLSHNRVKTEAPGHYQGIKESDAELTLDSNPLLDKHGYFAACLLQNGISPIKIKFNFVGLYDTVASYGVYHDNDVEDLKLNAIAKAHFVFQLSADDEYRENFDLTNITSAGINGLEYTLPGVHSDIGGSYVNNSIENAVLYYKRESLYNQMMHSSKEEVIKFKEIVIKEGWYKEHQIKAGILSESDINPEKKKEKFEETFYSVVGTRELRNTYDQIPLKKMFFYSSQFGVSYDPLIISYKHEIKDPFIQRVYNQLLIYMVACNNLRNSYVNLFNADTVDHECLKQDYLLELSRLSYIRFIEPEDLKTLRNQYLHWSVKANEFGLDSRESQAPSKEGALEQKYRKRQIHNG